MSGSRDLDANERLQACLWSACGNEDVSRHVLTDLFGRRGETEEGELRVTPKTLAERYGVDTARKVRHNACLNQQFVEEAATGHSW